MDIEILYEDADLLVINKPVGLVVNRAQSVKVQTLQDWIDNKFKVQSLKFKVEEENDFYNRSGIVHRIDKETSGCLIIARNPESFYKLQAAFKERLVKKEYAALVHGHLVPQEGEINAPIGRLPWNRERFGVVPGGKEAHTHYQVEKYYSDTEKNQYSYIRLAPTTGRTHQLRVHLKYLGFPIVGDYLYAGRKLQDQDRKWCPRVFLHAQKISFPQPVSGETITVIAPIVEELQKVIEGLTLV